MKYSLMTYRGLGAAYKRYQIMKESASGTNVIGIWYDSDSNTYLVGSRTHYSKNLPPKAKEVAVECD